MPVTAKEHRARMGEVMDLLVAKNARVHYAQVRPMQTRTIHTVPQLRRALRSRKGVTMDCSESVTLICHLAGLRDPNGSHYNGLGFTGTLLDHLHHYETPEHAETGALVVFGAAPGEHVCMVRHHDRTDPLLFSHGTEDDPRFFRLSAMRQAFRGKPVTFLSVTDLIVHS